MEVFFKNFSIFYKQKLSSRRLTNGAFLGMIRTSSGFCGSMTGGGVDNTAGGDIMSKLGDANVQLIVSKRRDRANDYASILAELCHYRGEQVPVYDIPSDAGEVTGSIRVKLDGSTCMLEHTALGKQAVRQLLAGQVLLDLGYISRVVPPAKRAPTEPRGQRVRFDQGERWGADSRSRAAS